MERRLLVERERACDELVVACGMQPQVYAAGILKVCKFHLLRQAAGISAMTGADLWRRLELILDDGLSTRLLYVPRLLVAALAVLMTLVPIAGGYCQQCVSNGRKPAGRKPAGPEARNTANYASAINIPAGNVSFGSSAAQTFSGNISGAGGIGVGGAGNSILTLTGSNSYSGQTLVGPTTAVDGGRVSKASVIACSCSIPQPR